MLYVMCAYSRIFPTVCCSVFPVTSGSPLHLQMHCLLHNCS
uniref:Uncharacterized protein n=1 Tax=Anguilla anguilla TaxID=7936 RepID=A0A0E9RVR8_ANGAN